MHTAKARKHTSAKARSRSVFNQGPRATVTHTVDTAYRLWNIKGRVSDMTKMHKVNGIVGQSPQHTESAGQFWSSAYYSVSAWREPMYRYCGWLCESEVLSLAHRNFSQSRCFLCKGHFSDSTFKIVKNKLWINRENTYYKVSLITKLPKIQPNVMCFWDSHLNRDV